MRYIANLEDPMAVHGWRVRDAKPSLEAAAALSAPASGNPSVTDIAGLINADPLSSFQIGIRVLIGGVVVMDGFDVQTIGFVAPALTQDWHLDPTALGPIFG